MGSRSKQKVIQMAPVPAVAAAPDAEDLKFNAWGKEVLRFTADGKAFVRGKLERNDSKLYAALADWVAEMQLERARAKLQSARQMHDLAAKMLNQMSGGAR